jgi:phage gp36-like protein
MYLLPQEITTHLGAHQIEAISDGDETMLLAAIDAAVQEAKSYLKAYDITAEMQAQGSERNALLLIFIKDIAVWHFVNICNVNTRMELRQDRYERAVAWLKAVQRGEVLPDLPAIIDNNGDDNKLPYKVTSNNKRNNHV